ncbi:hypothetical protein Tco_0169146 [Tanacetum coccineum]
MLMKPQFFYDHTTKQALGFQNPFYLKKAQQLEPKLYDGNVIKNTSAIVILDSEETLMLAKESRSKMLLKQKDPMMLEKKVNTTPVDYVIQPSSRPTKVNGCGTTSFRVKTFEVKMNQALNKNERLLEQVINKDIVNKIMNSSVDDASVNLHECKKCLKLEIELLNKKDFVEKEIYDKMFRSFTTLEKHCISLDVDIQLNQEIFQRDNSVPNQTAPSFDQYFELNELKAQSQEKDKDTIKTRPLEEIETINIELDHRVSKFIAENEHLKQTYKQLYDSIKPARIRSKEQCDDLINQVNLKSVEISDLNASLQEKRVKPSTSASGSQPSGNTKKDKIQQTPSSTQKNKLEAHPRTVKSSLRNKNCFIEPKGNENVHHSKLNANSEPLYVKCNGCMLSDNHDLCVLDFIIDVNARTKSKSVKKSSKRKVWKPTGKVFTNIRYTWRPTGRTFTIVGNACPLTKITTTAEMPLRKPTALESDTPKPVVTLVYSRKPKKSKTNIPVSKPKNIKSLSANKKEPSKS